MFSKSCEYGLRAIIYIARQSFASNKVGMSEVADEIDSPKAFTSKILRQLTKSGLVKSVKGPYGGFEIEHDKLAEIKLSQVVELFDGDDVYIGCGLGLSKCDNKHPCPLHHKFIQIRKDLQLMLENTNLLELVENNKENLSWLNRKAIRSM